jgi:hypothetical protein
MKTKADGFDEDIAGTKAQSRKKLPCLRVPVTTVSVTRKLTTTQEMRKEQFFV